MSLRFHTVAFDLDGTLADTAPDLAAALNHALGEIGRAPVPFATVRTMIGHGTPALLRRGLAATGDCDDVTFDRAYPLLMRFYEEHIRDATEPYPGVEAALDALAAAGASLAVCTNKPERVSRLLIEALGWRDRFAAIVGGDTLPVRKPDAAPLRLAVERACGGEAAFVGDSGVDAATARAAGLPCVLVSFGFPERPARELGADRVIDHFDELVPALAAL